MQRVCAPWRALNTKPPGATLSLLCLGTGLGLLPKPFFASQFTRRNSRTLIFSGCLISVDTGIGRSIRVISPTSFSQLRHIACRDQGLLDSVIGNVRICLTHFFWPANCLLSAPVGGRPPAERNDFTYDVGSTYAIAAPFDVFVVHPVLCHGIRRRHRIGKRRGDTGIAHHDRYRCAGRGPALPDRSG